MTYPSYVDTAVMPKIGGNICPKCGQSFSADFSFCTSCGVPLEAASVPAATTPIATASAVPKICINCGTPLDIDASFCVACGTPVDVAPTAPVPAVASGVYSTNIASAIAGNCVSCGAPLEADAAFCVVCGTPVTATGVAAVDSKEFSEGTGTYAAQASLNIGEPVLKPTVTNSGIFSGSSNPDDYTNNGYFKIPE